MTESLNFTSGKRRDEPIMFTLDGREYGFRPPKRAVMVMPAYSGGGGVDYIAARFEYLEKGLNAYDWALLSEEAKRAAHDVTADEEGKAPPLPPGLPEGWRGPQAIGLEVRLRDDNDSLDTDTLEQIIQSLAEKVAARPTT